MSAAPLAGLRVLDLSKVLAGPLCAQFLGDMGADVIKVEPPGAGDETRHWPPFHRDVAGREVGTVFLSANRNKRSVVIDLRQAAGQAVLHRLAAVADVVIESFGPGVAARLGAGAAALCALNPRLVHCSISGYGSAGPMRGGKGYDVILQAFTGMLSITGERGGAPVRSPFSPVDQATGLHALIGILAKLSERERTGAGGTVEAALFDTATSFLGYFLQGYWERGTEPEKPGSGHESLCPYEAFDTADQPLILGVANDHLWRLFCRVAGLEAACGNAQFSTNAARVQNRGATVTLVRAALKQRPRDQWIELLGAAGIPCSPLHTLGELSAHPHALASGMLTQFHDVQLGTLRSVAQPLRFDGERTMIRHAPPLAGSSSRDILAAAGYTPQQIQEMAAAGIIGVAGHESQADSG